MTVKELIDLNRVATLAIINCELESLDKPAIANAITELIHAEIERQSVTFNDDMTREKMVAKKPFNDHVDGKCCPTCLERATFQTWKHGYPVVIKMNYCQACGQKLDWSEE